MKIYIYGPPCSGKSQLGKELAKKLNKPFLDLDEEIEKNAGMQITQIFEKRGEKSFRELESDLLKQVSDNHDDLVLSLGGGALISSENRSFVKENGRILFLKTKEDVLLQRLLIDQPKRPLLNVNPLEKMKTLLRNRKTHYNSFPLTLQTSGKDTSELVLEAQTLLGVFRIQGMGPEYDVQITNNYAQHAAKWISNYYPERNCLLITDENVNRFHTDSLMQSLQSSNISASKIMIGCGEQIKTLKTVEDIYSAGLEAKLDRGSLIIALGGGIVGDLSGFAAATFMRGIDWLNIPTTLLAMCDSSLGGKTGANLPQGKNLVGAFHAPKLTMIDQALLNTLPEKEMINGLAEVLKHGFIQDLRLLELCSQGMIGVEINLNEIIRRAVGVKARIIQQDPYEKGIRKALNLGHTIGHGIERASNYQIPHGFAVSIGMVQEALLAWKAGISKNDLSPVMAEPLRKLGLPVDFPAEIDRGQIIHDMGFDKKRANGVEKFSLLSEIGQANPNVEIRNWQDMIRNL